MSAGYRSLSEKERETLRLILLGHDAKSMADELDLSVHTINERLRNARRKLGVTSSKEAARLLHAEESQDPHSLGYKPIGGAEPASDRSDRETPNGGKGRGRTLALTIGGLFAMSLVFSMFALGFVPVGSINGLTFQDTQPDEVEVVARSWLELVDAGDWLASYQGTDSSFRELNSAAQWAAVSGRVRTPLGATLSRRLISAEVLPTPQGYNVVRFQTDFANQQGLQETVTLIHEDGEWRVSGIFVE